MSVAAGEANRGEPPLGACEPGSNDALEFSVEVCMIGSKPQSTASFGDIVWVDVDATDHISCRLIEHRVGECLAASEFLGMLDEIGTVLIE
jgi:hypothetical protein